MTRLNEQSLPFEVEKRGSDYITLLHRKLTAAKALAEQVNNLNPNCQTIGAGYMANMQDLAKQVLEN